MKAKMVEDIKQITCRVKHRDKQSLFVMLEKDLENELRLCCEKCIETKKGVLNAITFNDAKQRIEKQQNRHLLEMSVFIHQKLMHIDDFQKTIRMQHQKIQKFIQDLEDRLNQWKSCLLKFQDQNCTFSFIQELSNLEKEENQWAEEKKQHSQKQINLIDHEHSINLKLTVDEIYQQVQNIINAEQLLYDHTQIPFKNQFKQQQKEQKNIQQENLKSMQGFYKKLFNQQIQTNRQTEICYTIGFNKDDSIMAAGYNECIKIWKIQNEQFIDSQIILQGKSEVDVAICIIFSKRTNLFVYGSYDHSIGLWNEIQNDKWYPSYHTNEISHSGIVTCIFLNQNDDQLISGSQDKSIIIWKINGTSIKFDQQLNKHTDTILGISMNQSETEIVSMSKDQSLIIWGKIQNQWKFKQVIQQYGINFGHIVTFISDYVLVLYQNFYKITYIREKVDNHFIQSSQLSLDLNQIVNQDEQQFLFPTFYYIHKNIIVQKYDGHIYFVVVNQDFQLQSLSKLEINKKNTFFGNMTKNGKYLVVWNYGDFEFKMYKITYL